MDSHLASCPSFVFRMGRCALVIELGSSTALGHLVMLAGLQANGSPSRPSARQVFGRELRSAKADASSIARLSLWFLMAVVENLG
jgi:hypothetical protein